jgi:tryptophan synthase alpha subunit
MIRFIKFLIASASVMYNGMPFAQCVHDGGTIQKTKYEAVGVQFIGTRYAMSQARP